MQQGKKTLSVDVPAELYWAFAEYCVEKKISKTEAVTNWLKKVKGRQGGKDDHTGIID